MSGQNTALVLHIASADALTQEARAAHDPSASEGMPAHVTLLYPFMPFAELTQADIAKLNATCRQHDRIDVTFSALGRFPGVLWLAPEPALPIRNLTLALCAAFPDWLPYGGDVDMIVPHLTLAHLSGSDAEPRLNHIATSFMTKAQGQLPLRQSVLWVSLFDRAQGGRWREVSGFPLR
jgi:2'-5' RNA ligase